MRRLASLTGRARERQRPRRPRTELSRAGAVERAEVELFLPSSPRASRPGHGRDSLAPRDPLA